MDTALGISPENSKEENIKAVDSFFDATDTVEGEARRKAVDSAQRLLDGEFHALGAEIGWFYPDIDVDGEGEVTRHDGQVNENGELDTLVYHPSTIPGHHLPHVWLERRHAGAGASLVSTRDLVRYDGFVLFTSRPDRWRQATTAVAGGDEKHVEIHVVGILSPSDGEESKQAAQPSERQPNAIEIWTDTTDKWPSLRGVSASGAVLVRPDGIVAWRAMAFDDAKHSVPGFLGGVVARALKL